MLNWLLIGVGDIATKRVLPAILSSPRSRLVGIVTRDPEKARPYNVPGWTSLDEAFAQSGASAAYIATPVFLHAPQTIAALQAGMHVLCEKPMAINHADAARMHEAAVAAGRILGIAYYRRLYPKVLRAKELLAQGAIGRPVFAEASSHDWFHPTGGSRTWLIDPAMAGHGPLRDIGSHRIDLMHYLFGEPRRVSGQISTLVHPTRVEDNATVMVDHESGVRSVVDVRWHSRVARDEFRIRGTEGEMDLTPLNGPSLVYPGGSEQIPAPANLHFPCIDDFVNAVLDGREPVSTSATALPTEWAMDQAAK
jgi:predicted dehydrogenase